MNVKGISTSIIVTNVMDKKYLSIKSFNCEEQKNSKSIEVENTLENSIIKNFLNTSIKSIKYVKSFIANNEYRECIELKNSGNSNLIIISDDANNNFKDLLEYIDENRTKIYEKYLFDCICKYEFNEIVFKLNSNCKNSEVLISDENGNTKLIYLIPYTKDDKNKIIINQKDLELIQNTINNYFGITGCNMKGVYDDAVFNYMNKFIIYTDKADIIVEGNDIYKGLELYFGVLKRDYDKIFLEQRDKDFKESQKNIVKSRLRIFKKEKNNEE